MSDSRDEIGHAPEAETTTASATAADARKTLGRRELLTGAGALAGMALAAGPAFAKSHESHGKHAGHDASEYSEAKAAKAHPKLVAATDECLRTGRDCFSHCLETFRDGDTKMADCAWSVEQMMQVCEAFGALASYDSTHLEEMASVCAKVCADCEKECRVHEKHQRECRRCADACAELIKQIKAMSA